MRRSREPGIDRGPGEIMSRRRAADGLDQPVPPLIPAKCGAALLSEHPQEMRGGQSEIRSNLISPERPRRVATNSGRNPFDPRISRSRSTRDSTGKDAIRVHTLTTTQLDQLPLAPMINPERPRSRTHLIEVGSSRNPTRLNKQRQNPPLGSNRTLHRPRRRKSTTGPYPPIPPDIHNKRRIQPHTEHRNRRRMPLNPKIRPHIPNMARPHPSHRRARRARRNKRVSHHSRQDNATPPAMGPRFGRCATSGFE